MTSNTQGRTIYFAKGMTADCESKHGEWLTELQRRAEAHDDLLAALREIHDAPFTVDTTRLKLIARAAIAKAEGT